MCYIKVLGMNIKSDDIKERFLQRHGSVLIKYLVKNEVLLRFIIQRSGFGSFCWCSKWDDYHVKYYLRADNEGLNFQKKLSATGLRKSIPVISIHSFARTSFTVFWDLTVRVGSTICIEVKLKRLVCRFRLNRYCLIAIAAI